MKIVIDLPEEDYKLIKSYAKGSTNYRISLKLYDAIKKGIPLPEHHGRLIDADAIEYTHTVARCLEDGHNWNELCVTKNDLYDAPTIIEGSESE